MDNISVRTMSIRIKVCRGNVDIGTIVVDQLLREDCDVVSGHLNVSADLILHGNRDAVLLSPADVQKILEVQQATCDMASAALDAADSGLMAKFYPRKEETTE